MNHKNRVLLVDADLNSARYLQDHLGRRNFEVTRAGSAEEAIRLLTVIDPALAVLDLSVPGMDGVDGLERIKQIKPELAVIVVSAQNNPELIFRASKLADDYLPRPFEPNDLENRIAKVQDKQRLATEVTQLREQVRRHDFTVLFGASPKMEDVKLTIEQVADTNATVLIRGESGTGKEVVARMIYANSGRQEKPFIKVNCAAIPYELLESELFGYEPGAFTGANRQKLGKFELANAGTIFLDEISEMHPALQAKLLHVLQDGEFSRLGGKRDIAVAVRVLAATNKPLERAVEQRTFREDLFYRLNVVTIHIPPLRERQEEIPLFLDFFLHKYSEYYGKQQAPFSDYAVRRMLEYSWPGNIRELENMVKRYVIVGNEQQIIRELSTHKPILDSYAETDEAHARNPEPSANAPARPVPAEAGSMGDDAMPSLLEIGRRAAMQAEQAAIARVLNQTHWNRRQAAKILKVSYKAFLNKLKVMEEQGQGTPAEAGPK